MRRSLLCLALFPLIGCGGNPAAQSRLTTNTRIAPEPGQISQLVRMNGSSSLRSIAIDANHLYFATASDGLYAMPRYGGEATVLDSSPDVEQGFVINDSGVFWSVGHGGDVGPWRTQIKFLGRGQEEPKVIFDEPVALTSELHLSKSDLVFGMAETPKTYPDRIVALPFAGGQVRTVTEPSDGNVSWTADDLHVYKLTRCDGPPPIGAIETCTLLRFPLAGGPAETVSTATMPLVFPQTQQDAHSFYERRFNADQSWDIASSSKSDGSVTALHHLTPGEGLGMVAVDETSVYLLNGSLHLLRMPKAGGEPVDIFEGPGPDSYPTRWIVDRRDVYMLNQHPNAGFSDISVVTLPIIASP